IVDTDSCQPYDSHDAESRGILSRSGLAPASGPSRAASSGAVRSNRGVEERTDPVAEHIYRLADRQDVEVEVDGTWWPGELRGWWDRRGTRLMNVSWRTGPGLTY